MPKKGYSQKDAFGGYNHYDEKGRKTGSSRPNTFGGGYTHYDVKGRKTGSTEQGFLGGYTHYDAKGHKTGRSERGLGNSYNHYDSSGKKVGGSDPGVFTSYNHNDTGGCYIATCVYGSYDCPEVWTLRRFRDNILANTYLGRCFIRLYYAVSPTVVRWFGHSFWFHALWLPWLETLVQYLQEHGIENTPYQDKSW